MTTARPGSQAQEEQAGGGAPAPGEAPKPAPYDDHGGRDDIQHRTEEDSREQQTPAGEALERAARRESIDDEAAAVQRPPADS